MKSEKKSKDYEEKIKKKEENKNEKKNVKKEENKKEEKEKDKEKDNNINNIIELKDNENEIINDADKEDEECNQEEKIKRNKNKFKNYDILEFLYNVEEEENFLRDSGETMHLGFDMPKKYKKRLFSFSKDSINSTREIEHFPRNKFSFVKENLNICGILEQKYDLNRSMPNLNLKNNINLKGK